ncbi:alkaline phosphatase family protein [bacterium]|nr:alkaline phosphatase family protein [bacterium]
MRYIIIILSFATLQQSILAQDTLKIAFGSCNRMDSSQTYWNQVTAENPDHWLWLGDNLYADTDQPDVLKQKYDELINNEQYKTFKSEVKIDGTWDDHDYGWNDEGSSYALKNESKSHFIRLMDFDSTHPIHEHEGIYHSTYIEKESIRLKVIFLDTRTFRSDLKRNLNGSPVPQPTGTILGEEQWQWLEMELQDSSVQAFIIASSIQVLSSEHLHEKWANFPNERNRLLQLIRNKPVMILSGDRHHSEFSKIKRKGADLYEFTSSGLTHSWEHNNNEPNELRCGKTYNLKSFGMLNFYIKKKKLFVEMSIQSLSGDDTVQAEKVKFKLLN